MLAVTRRSFFRASVQGIAVAAATAPFVVGHSRNPAIGPLPEHLAPDTLFLTWQGDPTTTMTVQWVGQSVRNADRSIYSSPAPSPYQIDSDDGDLWVGTPTVERPFPKTNLTLFRCELTGLAPDTEYLFRLGLNSPEYRFRTMPAKATDALSFVSGGDCGVNPHVATVNALAAKQDPYFALIGGDLAYDNGQSAPAMLGFLRNYSRHMVDTCGRLIPMLACIGNHEVDKGGYNGKRSDSPFFLALFDGLFKDKTYAAVDFGDYMSLILLDTGHIAPIGGAQTAWLDHALRERTDRPHLIAVNHVPAYPSHRNDAGKDGTGAENRKHWLPLFERHNVDVVLEHHDHTFKRTHPMWDGHVDRDGIVYLGDGSWGQLRAPNKPETRPYLAATGEAYHVSLHRLEGQYRYHLAMEESGKIVDVCTTVKRPRQIVRASIGDK